MSFKYSKVYWFVSELNNVGKHKKHMIDDKTSSNVHMPPSLNLSYPITFTFLS